MRETALRAGLRGPTGGLVWLLPVYALTETPVVAVPDAGADVCPLAPNCCRSCCMVL